ncbi:MAG TPA: molybdate ABC transporter permease subunit [Anaerolineales bacterium]|nr:molybdate ABC transporter permease subunit [Anaerolineales bacterium]
MNEPKRLHTSKPRTITKESPKIRYILVGLVVTYVGILILLPIVALVVGAFQEGIGGVISSLNQSDVLQSFRLTLYISLIIVIVHVIFGTLTAWVLVRHKFAGRNFINGLIDLPFAVSPVVVGYMLLLLFGRNGIFAPVLETLGVKVVFAVPGMILATLFVTLPFMIRELIPVLENLGIDQEQAAATMGANGWQIFWKVTFPALRWGLVYGIMLTFARALGEFGAILVVGGGIQGRTETATLYIYRALDERQYTSAYSAALVLGLISFLLVIGTDMARKRQQK